MELKTIELDGVDLVVYYKFEGTYYPETRESPTEFPDLIIDRICVSDSEIDITNLLSDWKVQEIEDILWANEY